MSIDPTQQWQNIKITAHFIQKIAALEVNLKHSDRTSSPILLGYIQSSYLYSVVLK